MGAAPRRLAVRFAAEAKARSEEVALDNPMFCARMKPQSNTAMVEVPRSPDVRGTMGEDRSKSGAVPQL